MALVPEKNPSNLPTFQGSFLRESSLERFRAGAVCFVWVVWASGIAGGKEIFREPEKNHLENAAFDGRKHIGDDSSVWKL